MAWEINVTDEFEDWWDDLSIEQQAALAERVALLAQRGPALKRPVVGEIKGSKHDPRMKELRAEVGNASLRVLFLFDPRREAILLVGGDKAGQWGAWYREAIPQADELYDVYLRDIGEAP